jgi:hypothetical protein
VTGGALARWMKEQEKGKRKKRGKRKGEEARILLG